MRGWRWIGLFGVIAVVAAAVWLPWFRPAKVKAEPLPVPGGDQEIAWLNSPTSFETWDNFVWGVKRAEMPSEGVPANLKVDVSGAYPEKTTDVPEVVLRREGYEGAIRFRWYKVTPEAPQEAWVKALAARDPAPLAVLAGWSSVRAKQLADAMRTQWRDGGPLYFLAQATADNIEIRQDDKPGTSHGPPLISLYDRSFRFCFTNNRMANAVTEFVLSDPTLRPGPVTPPALESVPVAAVGGFAVATALDAFRAPATVPAYAISWEDDTYSKDLSEQFRRALQAHTAPGVPRLLPSAYPVRFSVGRFNRANPDEAEVAQNILANLPPPGVRSVLIIPTVTAPARRTLRAMIQGNPEVGRQLVAVSGDGLGVNAFFRDREFAWPARSITVPFVGFTHAHPFGWDRPGRGPKPPTGYELHAPEPGRTRSGTEDIRNFTRFTQVLATAAFAEGEAAVSDDPEALAKRLKSVRFFDAAGERLAGTGEHVVVVRPVFPGDPVPANREEAPEVYTRKSPQSPWERIYPPAPHPVGGAE